MENPNNSLQKSVPLSDEAFEDMQNKLNQIYNEIQILSEYIASLDPNILNYVHLKHAANLKRETFKKEFRTILIALQEKSTQNISSDEVRI
jgi:hypothetical protein